MKEISEKMLNLIYKIKDDRCFELAKTKLEECEMWIMKGLIKK